MPVAAPARIARGAPKERGGKNGPRRTTSHKFRARDFVRKRQNESLEDHYSLGKLLGEGQFGEVFIGTVKKSNGGKGDNRAIKRIQKELLTEEDHDEVFNEFNILKELDNPNIAKMFEFFEDQDSFWFVQELCSGGELLDELERTETFSEAAAALIMKQVLSSVNYCHTQKQVVHRDLKLENILLVEGAQKASNGEAYNPMSVKVIDYGLATKFEEDQVLTSPVGSMHYIAPEVIEQEYGYKCDIWSCGVIAYILLCGYAPFEAANDRDMRELIMMGRVSYEDPIWKNRISQDAKDFVSYLLTYEPEKRPDAEQALQHEWIKKASKIHAEQFKATKRGTDAAVRVLSNIRSFEAASKLKQATCAFMTSQLVLSGDESEKDATNTAENDSKDPSKLTAMMIGEIFRAIDTDSDGQVSREELRLGFLDFLGDSAGLTVEEVDDIFLRVDLAFTGFIDYSEFVVASMGLHDQEQAHHKVLLKQAFERLLDKDGSGFISHEKLRMEMAPFYGEDVEEHIIQKIIDQADADQDGQISWDDFQAMMSKTADFVPPENATPLSSHQKQTEVKAVPAAQPATEEVDSLKAVETAQEEDATAAGGSETIETVLPVDTTTKTLTTGVTPARKPSRSNAGPKARLLSAMFEKNLEKNREMGFDKFTYTHQRDAAKAGGPKRKLPRTRRVNIEELTKKANAQVNFDPNAVKAGRNKEIEQLKSSPGMARQRRATIVNMFQQEKPETRNRRESRLLELQSLKNSTSTDRKEKARSMFNKPQDTGLSKARMKAEELKELQKAFDEADEAGEPAPSKLQLKAEKLKESQEAFNEADEEDLDSPLKQEFAKQRPSEPWLPNSKPPGSDVELPNPPEATNSETPKVEVPANAEPPESKPTADANPSNSPKQLRQRSSGGRINSARDLFEGKIQDGKQYREAAERCQSLSEKKRNSIAHPFITGKRNSVSSLGLKNNGLVGGSNSASDLDASPGMKNYDLLGRSNSASNLDLMNDDDDDMAAEGEGIRKAVSYTGYRKRGGSAKNNALVGRSNSASSLNLMDDDDDTTEEGIRKAVSQPGFPKRVGNGSFNKRAGNGSFTASIGTGESCDELSESPETKSPALSPVPTGSNRGVRGGMKKRATAPPGSLGGMTEAQAKFLEMANERANKAKTKENETANPQVDEETKTQ